MNPAGNDDLNIYELKHYIKLKFPRSAEILIESDYNHNRILTKSKFTSNTLAKIKVC